MKLKLSEPGYVVSGGVHLLVLLLLIVTFAKPEQFDPMQETVPIETISDSEFNKVMQGDKSAPAVLPDATAKIDKVDPTPDPTPKPPTATADKAVPTPPPPPVQQPVQPPTPPTPPTPPPVAAETPPTPPVPTPPTPPMRAIPPVPTPPQRVDADAEPIAPKPVPQPPRPPERVTEAKPMPPVKPHPVPKPPKAVPKPDQLAKLLEQTPEQPVEKPTPKAAKPMKPQPVVQPPQPQQTDEQSQSHTFDLTDITKLLSHDPPAQKAATGRAPSRVASLGSPTAHDDKMAPSLWGQLDGLMEEQYRQCWSYLGLTAGQKYVPQIRVTYDENGGLEADPVLVNPPSDPALRALADSAMRAVRRCNPLRIPAQYAPYYDEWKGRVLRFDPQEMAG